jgi:carboxyl-terminal processing protease
MSEYNEETVAQRPRKNNFLGAGLAVLLAAAAFFSGLNIGVGSSNNISNEAGIFSLFHSPAVGSEEVNMTEFWEVWRLLEEKYVSSTSTDAISVQDRLHGAIQGLVRSYGDPYTVFLPPSDAYMFEEDISGNFGGVGMEVGLRDDLVTVIAPLPNTPASKAGIVSQDVIVEIDGTSTDGMSIDEAVRLIRGEPGTTVDLRIYREGEMEFLDITIVRENIAIPTIETKEEKGVFIITLYSFNAIAQREMIEALEEYAEGDSRKLVLDLRGNPGGFLQSAVAIASYFLPQGKIVVQENFGEGLQEEIYRSQGRTLGEYAPEEMLVLVDGGSASASEILAGALQEHGVAKLMGEQTFGKGSVQELVSLEDGSSLKVTVARWFTPNGVSISEGGLTPDIFVERTPQQVIEGIDPQLEAAIAYLNGDKTVGTTTAPTAE